MAEVTGVNVTKYDAGTSDTTWIDQGLIQSSIKIWSEVYEAAALPAADTIVIAELPAGAVVHGIQIAFDALGAATVDVGDVLNPDRYIDGLDVSVAGSSGTDITTGLLVDGAQYVIGTTATDERITITVVGAAITGTIKTAVYYTN